MLSFSRLCVPFRYQFSCYSMVATKSKQAVNEFNNSYESLQFEPRQYLGVEIPWVGCLASIRTSIFATWPFPNPFGHTYVFCY